MTCSKADPQPPVAKVVPHELEAHGDVRIDDYFWLRERENPEVISYLEAENAYMDAVMVDTAALQTELFDEIKGRIKQTDSSVPARDHGYLYYHRTEDGKEYKIHCRIKDEPGAEEEVLLDVNAIAEGTRVLFGGLDSGESRRPTRWSMPSTPSVGASTPSVQGSRDRGASGRRDPECHRGGRVVQRRKDPHLHQTGSARPCARIRSGATCWGPIRPTMSSMYQEDDETFSVYIDKTESDRFILIESDHTLTTEYRFHRRR